MNNSGFLYNFDDWYHCSDDEHDDGGFSLRSAVVDEHGTDLKKGLQINNYDDEKKKNIYYEEEEEEEEEDEDITEALLIQMGYGETKTRPSKPKEGEEEEDDLLNHMSYEKTGPPKHEPPTTPIPAENLKSAMKGSRKKEGLPDKERKVTWAEDVYDPIPSATINRSEGRRNQDRKSRKNVQKCGGKGGKANGKDKHRGGKDKEKKQGRGGGAKGTKAKDKKQSKKCFDTSD